MPISEVLLATFSLLFLAMTVSWLCRHIALPYTVLLVIVGLSIKASENYLPDDFALLNFQLTNELVLFVFLPALIFESALSLDARSLLRNLIPVLVLAVPGMVMSMLLVGLSIWVSLELNLLVALLFGALISATDPVAVVALFKELGVPRRLMILVEGESLFNDATAIVLFNILLTFVLTNSLTLDAVITIIPEFLRVFLGGILVGAVISLVLSELMVRFFHGENSLPVVLSMCMAYFCFIIAEHTLHVSGVMAVLTAAICLNLSGLMRLSTETSHAVHNTWEVFVLICNSLLFIMIGLSVDIFNLMGSWQSVLIAVLAVTLARSVAVYCFVPLTTKLFKLPHVSLDERHIMWWGGLKGGLAIAIVLSIPDSMAEKQALIDLTVGVVMISLLVNATTVGSLIHWLKIDRLSANEWAEYQQQMVHIKRSVDQIFKDFAKMQLFDLDLQNSVEGAFEKDLSEEDEPDLSESQKLNMVWFAVLQAELRHLEYLHEIGIVNYYTYMSFRDVLKRDGETIQNLEGAEQYPDNKTFSRHEREKSGRLEKFELYIFRFLGELNWAQGILLRYQETRFSNRLQFDIAGVLLIQEALKVIESYEQMHGESILRPIRQTYENRLVRRQLRLDDFKQAYADFYQQFEYFQFQKVALLYSLKLIHEDHEANKLGTKACKKLENCLHHALRQLPEMKLALQMNKRDDWIRKVPLFAGLPLDSLNEISRKSRYVNLLNGDTLFNESEKGHTLYIIVSGKLNVFKRDETGESQYIAELNEGDFVGEHALLKDERRSATVRAKTYVTLLRFSAKDIINLSALLPPLRQRLEEAEQLRTKS